MAVCMRNVADFEAGGVALINPWEGRLDGKRVRECLIAEWNLLIIA